eukprot:COSAG02_NODE_8534_length_2533_cov_3.289647_2_plen_69_part_00
MQPARVGEMRTKTASRLGITAGAGLTPHAIMAAHGDLSVVTVAIHLHHLQDQPCHALRREGFNFASAA